jgi:serine/threonine-protein phosphatase 2A regulatory subunit B
MDARAPPPPRGAAAYEYRYMTEFQSHEPEFDYLKSLEIEEKINKVRWCRSSSNTRMLLSTNDKTVKLWKVGPAAVPGALLLPVLRAALRERCAHADSTA